MNSISKNVLSINEASELWGVDISTLQYAISTGNFKKDELYRNDYKWLIVKDAMVRIFGEAIKSTTLFTIGYEGKTINNFIEMLLANHIETLWDVRELPLSRKKGFSKNALHEALSKNNIQYKHIRELGSPKEIREQLHTDNNYTIFFNKYQDYLDSQLKALEMIGAVMEYDCSKRMCLMCFEKEPERCHRSLIAAKLVNCYSGTVNIINL